MAPIMARRGRAVKSRARIPRALEREELARVDGPAARHVLDDLLHLVAAEGQAIQLLDAEPARAEALLVGDGLRRRLVVGAGHEDHPDAGPAPRLGRVLDPQDALDVDRDARL